MEAKSKFEIKRNLSFEKSSYRMNDKICQTNGRSFEKIQHLSVMVGFKMDAKTLFERLFEFMLLNENWMKWDN